MEDEEEDFNPKKELKKKKDTVVKKEINDQFKKVKKE